MRKLLSLLILPTMLFLPYGPVHAADPIDPDVLALRESVWRAWFAGDEKALLSMLPEDFLGIGWGGTEIATRQKTIADSRQFKEAGGRLIALSFPETRAQRIGDTVIFYGSYEVTLAIGTAEEKTKGRLTEVFVKRDGRWLHPGWHLDSR